MDYFETDRPESDMEIELSSFGSNCGSERSSFDSAFDLPSNPFGSFDEPENKSFDF
jgi:hypothetical protein